ncbi:MAG: hypothetical protein LBR73_02485 [Oscillospiraceae bacterium]|jgi:hypothetical protein|nr:hypothetical protein [Oscillospiraceae bacterium]
MRATKLTAILFAAYILIASAAIVSSFWANNKYGEQDAAKVTQQVLDTFRETAAAVNRPDTQEGDLLSVIESFDEFAGAGTRLISLEADSVISEQHGRESSSERACNYNFWDDFVTNGGKQKMLQSIAAGTLSGTFSYTSETNANMHHDGFWLYNPPTESRGATVSWISINASLARNGQSLFQQNNRNLSILTVAFIIGILLSLQSKDRPGRKEAAKVFRKEARHSSCAGCPRTQLGQV